MRFFRAVEEDGFCKEGDIFVVSKHEHPKPGELVLMANGIQRYTEHHKNVIGVVIETRRGINREPIYRRALATG